LEDIQTPRFLRPVTTLDLALALVTLLTACDPSSQLLVRNDSADALTLRLAYTDGQSRFLDVPGGATAWAISPVVVATRPQRVEILDQACVSLWSAPFGEGGMLVIGSPTDASFASVPSDAPPASTALTDATRCTGLST
jgi:hypothetical protein